MEVGVTMLGVEKLVTSSRVVVEESGERRVVTKVSFEAEVAPGQIARILNFQKQGKPLDAIISSPQSVMDLRVSPVNTETGEIKEVKTFSDS